jgi:hypothetical protein
MGYENLKRNIKMAYKAPASPAFSMLINRMISLLGAVIL